MIQVNDIRKLAAPAAAAGTPQMLRVVLVLDPAQPGPPLCASLDMAGVDVAIHLAPLTAIVSGVAFLSRADILIVEVDPRLPGHAGELARIIAEHPLLPVVAAGRSLTLAQSRRLRALGAVEVLALPIDAVELGDALDAVRRSFAPAPGAEVRQGRVVAVMGAVGGAGTTMVGTQLGCLWAATTRTCLIDFNIQAATAALYLDLMPPLGVADLVEAGARLDGALLTSVAARHASGLAVIAGPPEMVPLDLLTPAIAADIIRLATQAFDLVLVELPLAWTDWSLSTMVAADLILLVSVLSVPGVRQTRRLLDVIEANGLASATRLVFNRVPKKLFRTVDFSESETLLRRKVEDSIADDFPTVSTAIDQGRQIGAVRAGCAVDKDLKAMRARIDEALTTVAPA